MKTKQYFGLIALSLCVASCQQNDEMLEEVINKSDGNTFSVVMEQPIATRMSVTTGNGKATYAWTDGDVIGVVDANGVVNEVPLTVEDSQVTFTYSGTPACAVYPNIFKEGVTDGVPTKITLPTLYENYQGSVNAPMFANMTQAGKSAYQNAESADVVEFKHLAGMLSIQFTDIPAGCDRFTFTADNKHITGDFVVDTSGSNPEIKLSETNGNGNSVTFTFQASETAMAKTFYIPLPVGTYEGFTIQLTNSKTNEVFTKTGKTGQEISRNTLAILPPVDNVTSNLTEGLYYSTDNGPWTLWGTSAVMPEGTYTSFAVLSVGDTKMTGSQLEAIFTKTGLKEIDLSNSTCVDDTDEHLYGEFQYNTTLEYFACPSNFTRIYGYAFDGCTNLRDISLPESVKTISGYAFWGCTSLTEVHLPTGVTLGDHAFDGCTNLKDINIANIAGYGDGVFVGCSSLEVDVTFPSGTTEIKYGTFNGCAKIKSVTFPEGLETIGKLAFLGCTSINGALTIPETVTTIGMQAFKNMSGITEATIPDGIKKIPTQLFWGCSSLETINYASDITSLGASSLRGTAISSITVPATVTTLGVAALGEIPTLTTAAIAGSSTPITVGASFFYHCENLTSVTFPANTKEIGTQVLRGCYKLADIYCHATEVPKVSENTFSQNDQYNNFIHDYVAGKDVPESSRKLYVPADAVEKYKSETLADGTSPNYWKTVLIDELGYEVVAIQ